MEEVRDSNMKETGWEAHGNIVLGYNRKILVRRPDQTGLLFWGSSFLNLLLMAHEVVIELIMV